MRRQHNRKKREREERRTGIGIITDEKVSISFQTRQSVQVITQETQGRVRHMDFQGTKGGRGGDEMIERGRWAACSGFKEAAACAKARQPPPPLIQLEVFDRTRRKGRCRSVASRHPSPHALLQSPPKPNMPHPGVVSLPGQRISSQGWSGNRAKKRNNKIMQLFCI